MIRLFLIEWIKLRKYRAFQILVGLYFLMVGVICSSGVLFLEFLKSKGMKYKNLDPTMFPIYEFPDVWPNIFYIAAFLKIFLALIVIISVTNEITYKTYRQNIIDGLNRAEFMISKISLIFILSLANTILVFLVGLICGLIYSKDKSLDAILGNMSFTSAFFLNIFTFLMFAFFVGLLIKRTGVAIVFIGIYSVMFEPILTMIFKHAPLPAIFPKIAELMPVEAISNLLPSPYPKYILREIQDYISFTDVAIVGVYLILFTSFIYLLLKRRNNV